MKELWIEELQEEDTEENEEESATNEESSAYEIFLMSKVVFMKIFIYKVCPRHDIDRIWGLEKCKKKYI